MMTRHEKKGQAKAPVLYPVLCAWCEKEGVRTVVNWGLAKNSHGICEKHMAQVLAASRGRDYGRVLWQVC